MTITGITPQLRTSNIAASIRFYTTQLGFTVEFNHEDFYVGLRAGDQLIHLKHVDVRDPSIDYVDEGDHLHLYLMTDDVAAFDAFWFAELEPPEILPPAIETGAFALTAFWFALAFEFASWCVLADWPTAWN